MGHPIGQPREYATAGVDQFWQAFDRSVAVTPPPGRSVCDDPVRGVPTESEQGGPNCLLRGQDPALI
jgi:hypothetical protein